MNISQRKERKRVAVAVISDVISKRATTWMSDETIEAVKVAMDILMDAPEHKWHKAKEANTNVKPNTDN